MHTVAFTDPVTGKETGFATPGYDGNADTFGQAIHAAMKAAWYGPRPREAKPPCTAPTSRYAASTRMAS
jgi:hypothetical protein